MKKTSIGTGLVGMPLLNDKRTFGLIGATLLLPEKRIEVVISFNKNTNFDNEDANVNIYLDIEKATILAEYIRTIIDEIKLLEKLSKQNKIKEEMYTEIEDTSEDKF